MGQNRAEVKTYHPRLFLCWERKILSGSLKAKKRHGQLSGFFLDGTRSRLLTTKYNCFSSLQLLTCILRKGGLKSQDRELITSYTRFRFHHGIFIKLRNCLVYQKTVIIEMGVFVNGSSESRRSFSRAGQCKKWL